MGGIGSFTVVDGSKVEVADLGNNFLGMSLGSSLQLRVLNLNISHFLHGSYICLLACAVDTESIGQSKAKCVCAFLQELNDAVGAKFVEESPEALLGTNPAFFSQFSLIIATQVVLF